MRVNQTTSACMNPLQTHHKHQYKTNLDPFHAYERSIDDVLTYAKSDTYYACQCLTLFQTYGRNKYAAHKFKGWPNGLHLDFLRVATISTLAWMGPEADLALRRMCLVERVRKRERE